MFYVPVAQLDRVSDSDSEGRAFESHRAYQKKRLVTTSRFFNEINPDGFVKCTLCVKYRFAIRNACGREKIYFISQKAYAFYFTICKANYFTSAKLIFHLKTDSLRCRFLLCFLIVISKLYGFHIFLNKVLFFCRNKLFHCFCNIFIRNNTCLFLSH